MIRLAQQDDMAAWLAIKNDPEALFWSGQARPVTDAEHQAWFIHALASATEGLYVVDDGQVRGYGRVQQVGLVSLAMEPTARRQGWGGLMLRRLAFEAQRVGLSKLLAVIHPSNIISVRAFIRAGYSSHPVSELVLQRVLQPGDAGIQI